MGRITRYLLSITLLSLVIILPRHAQTGDPRNNLSIGINGGVNMNRVTFSPRVRQNSIKGPTFGVTMRYISERWFGMLCGIQGELNFIQRGWDEFYESYPELQYTRKVRYVELPIMAHIGFGKETGLLKFFIHAGPQFSYYLSDDYTISGDWASSFYHQEQHDMEIQHKFDYGIIAGGGFEFHTGIGNFIVEGRYYLGLADMFDHSKKDYFSQSANSGIYVKATYLFDLKK